MSNDFGEIGSKAYEYCKTLVDIGPRPAGSKAERTALNYVEKELNNLGYYVSRQDVEFAPLEKFPWLIVLVGIILIGGYWMLPVWKFMALFSPVLVVGLPQLNRWVFSKKKLTHKTENVIACNELEGNQARLVFCAHIDSAQANGFRNRRLIKLYGQGFFFVQRAVIGSALISIMMLLGFQITKEIFVGVGSIISLVILLWVFMEVFSQLTANEIYSPGAYDNASGVAVVMSLANYFSKHPLKNVNPVFLITGAEETGMHGARKMARIWKDEAEKIAIINYDMVGAGQNLGYVEREGVFFPRLTSRWMNQLFIEAYPKVKKIWYTRRSGDYSVFLKYGIPSVSLQTTGSTEAEFNYHTVYDNLSMVKPDALRMTCEATIRFCELYDNRCSSYQAS